MSITSHTPMHKADARRYEMFTGSGRRPSFTAAEKAAIVAESYGDDNSVSGIARRHGLTPSQLFAWRRQAREGDGLSGALIPPVFVPAIIEEAADITSVAPLPGLEAQPPRSCIQDGLIEVDLEGVRIRIGREANTEIVVAVLRALRSVS